MLARGRLGTVDLVVDVQNGLPFFTRAATRAPVVVLVHHVHREQWPVVYPGLVGTGRLEHRAPARSSPLPLVPVRRGVASHPRRAASPSGSIVGASPSCTTGPTRSSPRRQASPPTPRSPSWVGLVPHKQVEHAIDAALALRDPAPRPPAARRGQRLVGGRASPLRRRAGRRRHRGLRGTRRRAAQARGVRERLGARPPVAEGGMGAGRRRGRHAPHPGRGLPLGGRHARVDHRRRVGAARRRARPSWSARWAPCSTTTSFGTGSATGRWR